MPSSGAGEKDARPLAGVVRNNRVGQEYRKAGYVRGSLLRIVWATYDHCVRRRTCCAMEAAVGRVAEYESIWTDGELN